MPAHDLALLVHAARAAGAIALRYWRHNPKSWEKPDGTGPVTEADIAINDMLAETLGAARPDYGWLSEESPDTPARLNAPYTFILDPIDGTRAFMAAEEHFAHSLAIARDGQITAAAVYLPAIDRLYTATSATPALCNGIPIHCSAVPFENASLLCSRPALAPDHWHAPPPVRRMFRASLAYRLCLVAEGAFDAMLTLRPTWEWDVAAGDLIATRAGALVTTRQGAPLGYNNRNPQIDGVIAAGPAVHRGLQAGLI